MNKILANIKLSLLGSLFAVLIGCGSTPESANGDQAAVPENPYLLNRQKVSREALSRFEKANAAIEKKQWQEAEQQLSCFSASCHCFFSIAALAFSNRERASRFTFWRLSK
jgi:hypothetical protein